MGRTDRVRARLRGVACLYFAAGPGLGRAGADRRHDPGGRLELLADLDRRIDRRRARRLAVLLDRTKARAHASSTSGRCRNIRSSSRRAKFIKKWGVLGIFIGRFSGPLRASAPLVAGIFEMPFWRFQFANFVSAFVWAACCCAWRCGVAGACKLICRSGPPFLRNGAGCGVGIGCDRPIPPRPDRDRIEP